MKQKLLLKVMLLLCALVAGSSSVWAADVVYKTQQFTTGESSTFSAGVSSYTTTFDNTYNGFTCNYSKFNNNNKGWTYVKCGTSSGASTGTIITDAAIDKPIKKVTLTIDAITSSKVTSITLYSSDSKSSGWVSVGTFDKSTGAKDVSISSPTANKYYKIEAVCTKGSSNGLLTISKIQFYIEHVAITSITLPSTESVAKGGTVTLTPTVAPANYTEAIDWESDDTDVATVSSAGVVTGVTAGTAHIKAKAHDNPSTIYGECTVTVTAPIAVTGVTLKSSTTIEVGKTETLVPTILPANATNKTVAWFSDDDTKVSVDDDGVITGLAVTGETPVTITVMTEDGDFEAECAVTVIPKNTDVNLTSPISITSWQSLSYGDAAEYEVEGVSFTATQCMNSSGLQFKKSVGILASPLIKSTYGYTVIVTTNDAGTGTLTLQIGSETPVSITSGSSTTYSATTSNTSVAFTLTNSSNKACNIASIEIVPYVPLAPAKTYTTLTSKYDLDFTGLGLEAYIVKDNDASDGYVTLTQVNKVPANTGLVLVKTSGTTFNVPVFDGTGADDVTGNLMAGSATTTTTVAANAGYILKDGAFHPSSGANALPAGKAYLNIEVSTSAPILNLDFGGGTTGINAVNGSEFKVNGEYYNLAGQRVANPTKGLYIVNGKKVIIK